MKSFLMMCLGFFVTWSTVWSLPVNAGAQVEKQKDDDMQSCARAFVVLAFQLSQFDPDYVDAYFGPEELKQEAAANPKNLSEIQTIAERLANHLAALNVNEPDSLLAWRQRNLLLFVRSLQARAAFLAGKTMTFDEESRAFYDTVAPAQPRSYYENVLKELTALLPGEGPLDERFNAYRSQFIIPTDKVAAVFSAAIAEGRKRTKEHIPLLEKENFELEYVKDKPWGAYNWFKGNAHSLIQVNTDLPIYVDRAVALACHEGYPGHHVYSSLIEQKLFKEKGWYEYSVYPLYSPLSLLLEGTANFGIEVAFPGQERLQFEKEVIFPLAGLNPHLAETYYHILALVAQLSSAGDETARLYLDKKISEAEAVAQFMKFQLMSKPRAEKYLDFVKRYRSYVINYNWGEQLVRQYIEKQGGVATQPQKRWQEFLELMSTPFMPGDLGK